MEEEVDQGTRDYKQTHHGFHLWHNCTFLANLLSETQPSRELFGMLCFEFAQKLEASKHEASH